MLEIVVDAYGGDYSPKETVEGALSALDSYSDFSLVIVGNKEEISLLTEGRRDLVKVVDAPEVITNNDVPTEAIRNKRNSSLVAAIDYMNANENAKALVSTGSTGAVLTGAVLLTRRIRGVIRPALAPVLPTVKPNKNVILIDCGAIVDPKPQNLVQYAQMGAAYSKFFKVDNPVVALLSNGMEDKKGNALNKEAFELLKNSNVNFVGNIEAREILSGDYDVIVADGFSGNIALKACEGTAVTMFELIKKGIMAGGLRAKLGYLLLKPVFKEIKHKMDYNDNGGAVLLGLEKIVVKGHGASKAKAVRNAVLQARELAVGNLVEKIAGEIAHD